MKISKLHYISQELDGKTHQQMVEEACKAGADWVQLRMKNKSYEEAIRISKEVKAICAHHHAKLIINDHVAIAKEIGADGVHLGKEDMDPLKAREFLGEHYIIGGTANTSEDIRRLLLADVSYIGLGPFRFTATKEKLSPVLGLEGYQNLLEKVKNLKNQVPVIAIGGIAVEDITALLETGVYGVAVSSLINKAADKKKIVDLLKSRINEFENSTVK